MGAGDRRIAIMEDCPEEFEDQLKEFIDELEAAVNDIAGTMDIRLISDIGNIDEAHTMAVELGESLY